MSRRGATISAKARAQVAIRHGVYPTGAYQTGPNVLCYWCGQPCRLGWAGFSERGLGWVSGLEAEFDHVVPHSLGGGNDADNLVLACRKCNRGRCNRPVPPGWEG